ncbi:MAG: tetratricopeptide repeat protein [Cytophagaceae bacterium]|jgi:predicted Zn-dependent protease|nr:tetratricopeptide repeat protein [Cytophagaceae bacterium]
MARTVIFLILFFLSSISILQAQQSEMDIADSYFESGEFSKAYDSYLSISKNPGMLPVIYERYLQTLLELKKNDEAEKLIRKMIKSSPDNLPYRLEHYYYSTLWNGDAKAEKELDDIIGSVKKNEASVQVTYDFLFNKKKWEAAKKLILAARKQSTQRFAFALPLSELYYQMGQTDLMVEELLDYLKENPSEREEVQNTFQNNFKEEKDFDWLEGKLYERIQKDPDEINFNELVLWLHIQRRQFNKAFIQAKAIDKRYRMSGSKIMEVASMAVENKDYENAVRMYQYVVQEYKATFNYPVARRELIRTREELVRSSYPVKQEELHSLILDYRQLIQELGQNQATMEARRNLALLYAFYLDNRDTATVLLQEVISLSRYDEKLKARAKLDLGDIYLLKGEPWESTLLYSQVEKDMKEDPIAHEAKLRNAKLSYYKGEFELAQEHLDVLKLATTREISNDAMELSILIQDNIGLDTSEAAMAEYAAIDLLLFQNKTDQALQKTENMLQRFAEHSLADELLWLKAKILRRQGNYAAAITTLETLLSLYGEDILGDNALFAKACMYHENLKDSAKAMEAYQQFLQQYPGSIYTVEARKRFRLLRGDKL